jgi:hypothetical protein
MNANTIFGLFWILLIAAMLYMHFGHGGHGGMGGCGGGHAGHGEHDDTGHDAQTRATVTAETTPIGTERPAARPPQAGDTTPVTLTKPRADEQHHHPVG